VLPPIQLTSPPTTPDTPKPPAVAPTKDIPQIPIDASFWRPMMLGLGTTPTGATKLKGATGIEHRVLEVGMDDKRKRLIVLNDASEPMVAAFIQSDLQRAYPEQRVIVARTQLVNLNSSLREAGKKNGMSSLTVSQIVRMIERKQLTKESTEAILGELMKNVLGDPKVKNHSPAAFALQLISQMTKFRWSDIGDDLRESHATIDSLLPVDDADVESQLGICTMPIYQVTADQVENVKASSALDPARELLLQMGVWGYFFPDSSDLTLGLIDHGIDTAEELAKAVALAPRHGHLIGGKEDVPKIEDVLAHLKSHGLIGEGEATLKVTLAGHETRAKVKFKATESLLVKLKNLSGMIVPLVKLFFSGHP
jgi:hypothetical protein